MIARAEPRTPSSLPQAGDALARFDAAREMVAALERYRERVRSAVSGFASACERCRSERSPGYFENADDFDLAEVALARHLESIDGTVSAFRSAEERLSPALDQARTLGFWPLLAVLAVALAGKVALNVSDQVGEHFRERKALENQLRDLRERCSRGQATPAACAMIPKLEASLASGPIDRLADTTRTVLWVVGGVLALSFLLRAFRR